MNRAEMDRVQRYLRKTFRLDTIELRPMLNKTDSAEVHIGDEFIGVIYRDEDEGELSYLFEMAILEMDLPPA